MIPVSCPSFQFLYYGSFFHGVSETEGARLIRNQTPKDAGFDGMATEGALIHGGP